MNNFYRVGNTAMAVIGATAATIAAYGTLRSNRETRNIYIIIINNYKMDSLPPMSRPLVKASRLNGIFQNIRKQKVVEIFIARVFSLFNK